MDKKLVVAVSSRALFNLENENEIFKTQGEKAYRDYQWKNKDAIINKGVAYPFVKRLLQFNRQSKEPFIEVILLSKNAPVSGLRAFKSCEAYKLDITRGAFTAGKTPYEYLKAFNASLFLSADKNDVNEAVQAGYPAGCVLPTEAQEEPQTNELRVAFDFDGVIADDSAESEYQKKGIDQYQALEKSKAGIPLPPGPLKPLIDKLSKIQAWEQRLHEKDASYIPKLRIAIVTARNAPAHERVITTLKEWGITAAEAFFLGGVEKKNVLEVFRPHLFFDDQMQHLEAASKITPCVHIPFGIMNREHDDKEGR